MATALVFNKVTRCFPFKLNRKLFLKRVPCNQISNFLHNGAISKNMELNNAAETTNKNFENKITILSHYRQYLLENSDMYPSVFTPGKCPQNSNSKTLEFLNEMQVNSNNEEDREKLKIYLSEELTSLTYPEFLGVLNLFAVKKLNDKTNPWPDVVLCLDNECFRRKNDLSVDEILKITDILYHSQNFFKFNFVYNRLSKYCHKGKNFTNKQASFKYYLQFLK